MASTRPATRPILVCGAARSGTTFLGELLKTSPDVEVLPELSPESVPSLFGLIKELRGTLHWQKWKEFSEGDIEARVIEVLRGVALRSPTPLPESGQASLRPQAAVVRELVEGVP